MNAPLNDPSMIYQSLPTALDARLITVHARQASVMVGALEVMRTQLFQISSSQIMSGRRTLVPPEPPTLPPLHVPNAPDATLPGYNSQPATSAAGVVPGVSPMLRPSSPEAPDWRQMARTRTRTRTPEAGAATVPAATAAHATTATATAAATASFGFHTVSTAHPQPLAPSAAGTEAAPRRRVVAVFEHQRRLTVLRPYAAADLLPLDPAPFAADYSTKVPSSIQTLMSCQ